MRSSWLAPFLLASTLLTGCGVSAYQPGRGASLDLDGAREINDEDVRKAFSARPQLATPARVALYEPDVSKADELEATLRKVPGVSDVYRIPPLMVTGQRRYDDARSAPSAELSLKKLRLIAARAQADLVVVIDHGHRIDSSPNGWVALSPLLVPMLFTPFLDYKVDSYLDAYVIDTRNGFLYAQIAATEHDEVRHVTAYHDNDALVRDQWQRTLASTQQKLRDVMTAASTAPPVAPVASSPPPTASSAPAAASAPRP